MEQMVSKVSKRPLWSVYVMVKAEVYKGRVLSRKHKTQRIMKEPVEATLEYLYLDITKMYKEKGILYIQEGVGKNKKLHLHDMTRVENIYIREYKRSGVQ